MHFSTYVIYENGKLTKDTKDYLFNAIEESFSDNYCYNCGETEPNIEPYCDWFQIGGRWINSIPLKAKKVGIKGELSWCNENEKDKIMKNKSRCDIANISDINLTKLPKPYAIVVNGEGVVTCDCEGFNDLFKQLKSGKFSGVLAQIDCHD